MGQPLPPDALQSRVKEPSFGTSSSSSSSGESGDEHMPEMEDDFMNTGASEADKEIHQTKPVAARAAALAVRPFDGSVIEEIMKDEPGESSSSKEPATKVTKVTKGPDSDSKEKRDALGHRSKPTKSDRSKRAGPVRVDRQLSGVGVGASASLWNPSTVWIGEIPIIERTDQVRIPDMFLSVYLVPLWQSLAVWLFEWS